MLSGFVENLCADGQFNDYVFAVRACAVTSHTVLACWRSKVLTIAKINQSVEVLIGYSPDIAALTAIAAIRAAELN